MLPSRWHHGHSLGAGLLGGLVLASYREWLLLALAFLLGAAATLVVINGRRLLGWVYETAARLTWRWQR